MRILLRKLLSILLIPWFVIAALALITLMSALGAMLMHLVETVR